jgi:hypothetical protein
MFMSKIIIIKETVKTIFKFDCMVCGTEYEKETHVPVEKVKDLSNFKNIGMCKKCSADANNPEVIKMMREKLKEMNKEMKRDNDNEILLL